MTARVGRRLTATPGSWDQDGLTFSYQWLSDGVVVPGARTGQYVVRGSDVGRRISVQVTARRGDGAPGVAESAATAPVRKAGAKVTARVGRHHPEGRPEGEGRRQGRHHAGRGAGHRTGAGARRRLAGGHRQGRRRHREHHAAAARPGRHRVVLSYPGSTTVGAAKDAVVVRTHR